MNLTEEMKKYRAPLVESLEDECNKMDKFIKKTDKDFINPKTAFKKKKKGPFAKKEVKEEINDGPSQLDDFSEGWNAGLDALLDESADAADWDELSYHTLREIVASLKHIR